MTSSIIIKSAAEKAGVTQKEVKAIADAIEVSIKETDGSGETFKALDVTYSLEDVPAQERRNPATGEKFIASAYKKVKAKLSADFKRIGK